MQKLYKIVKIMLVLVLYFTKNNLQAQKCCVECQADVKVVSDKQVLLEKIDLKVGILTTNINTNLYVSYRSRNTQKFWSNLVIATAGVAVSTQLNKATLSEGKSANGVSPLLPLGVSVATLPSIWKNRPRGVPQAGLYIIHRDTRGKLLDTWEQPISSEAKNDVELLTVTIDKPLSAGTLEIYLQNGSKNGIYYWGYGTTSKSVKPILQNPVVSSSMAGCPDGYLPNGNGMCCNPFNGDCVSEGGGTPPPPPPPTGGGCPSGYLPNGQGMCCRPSTNDCVSEGGVITPPPSNPNPTPTPPPTGGGCPEGYLPSGNGMCCNPFNGDCISEGGSVPGIPPTTQQTYSGEWKCTSGLLPTSAGNCLDSNTGIVYFPIFVINSSGSGGCGLGKVQVIDEDGSSVCIGSGTTFINPGVVVRPDKPNPPINPNHAGAASQRPYEPIPVPGGGGSGGSGSTGNGGGSTGNGPGRTGTGSETARQNIPNPVWIYNGNGPVKGPFGPSASSNNGGKIVFYFGGFPQLGEILTTLPEVRVILFEPLNEINGVVTNGIWMLIPINIPTPIRDRYQAAASVCQDTYDAWIPIAQADANVAAASFQALILSVGGTQAATSGLVAWVEATYGLGIARQLGIATAGYITLENLGIIDPIEYVTNIVKNAVYEKGVRIAQAKFVDCMVDNLSN